MKIRKYDLRTYVDKPARLIIRLLFGFAPDYLTNSTNLQIVRLHLTESVIETKEDSRDGYCQTSEVTTSDEEDPSTGSQTPR